MVGINRAPYNAERFSDEDDFLRMFVSTKVEAILYGGYFVRGDSISSGRNIKYKNYFQSNYQPSLNFPTKNGRH